MKIAYEKIVLEAGSSFAILAKRAAAFDGRFHFHPEYEITLIESSLGRRIVGDSIESFSPGDLVLLGENLPHQYVSDPAKPGPPAKAKVIQFGRNFLGEAFVGAPESAEILDLLERSKCGLRFAGDIDEAKRLIGGIFAASGFRRLVLLLDLLRALSADDQAQPIASPGYTARISSREGETIDKALKYLNERFAHPISFSDLCRHLSVTSATCNRLFRKSVGRSFKAVLIEIRISNACRLLLETERSIVDIAYASGFANLSNFNRRFKNTKARSPRDYRNLLRR